MKTPRPVKVFLWANITSAVANSVAFVVFHNWFFLVWVITGLVGGILYLHLYAAIKRLEREP